MAYGEGSVSFDHRGTECRDKRKSAKRHDVCTGRWYGVFHFEGHRYRVVDADKSVCERKLERKKNSLRKGLVGGDFTVEDAVRDWLKNGMPGRTRKTVENAGFALSALMPALGPIQLHELTGRMVREALTDFAQTHSQSSVVRAKSCLERAIRFAESNDRVDRNVVRPVETPEGQGEGNPSGSFTLEQVLALLKVAGTAGCYPMDAYIFLSILLGVRTEEARALEWNKVDLDSATPGVNVVRSVRRKGETKNRTSWRRVALPAHAAEALKRHKIEQNKQRLAAGELWEDHDLVFTDALGRPLNHDHVLDLFRGVLAQVPGIVPEDWTCRDMRHTFTSVLDQHGVPTPTISRLMGHSKLSTTETVYRHDLTPQHQEGALAFDVILAALEV
jgi:integrase